MALEPGAIVEAKVTGITKFGAFVALPEGKSGLVHISELANTYVNDVSEHVSVGQAVKVYVVSISPDGKINLSIKRALPQAARSVPQKTRAEQPRPQSDTAESFEDILKKFMKESDSRIADNRIYSEHRQRSRRR